MLSAIPRTFIQLLPLLLHHTLLASAVPRPQAYHYYLADPAPEYLPPVLHQSNYLRQPSQLSSCASGTPLFSLLCQVLQKTVEAELRAANIQITKDDIAFKTKIDKAVDIPGGSCVNKAVLRTVTAEARFQTDFKFQFEGNFLTKPLILPVNVPTDLAVVADVQQKFGGPLTCRTYASHWFKLNGRVETEANGVAGFEMNPSIKKLGNGDYELKVKPVVVFEMELRNSDLEFHTSNVNLLAKLWSSIVGVLHSPVILFGGALDVIRGKGVSTALKNIAPSLGYHLGSPILLGVGLLPKGIETRLYGLFENVALREASKAQNGVVDDFERNLNSQVARALKLKPDGTRSIIIPAYVVTILKLLGVESLEDLLSLPSIPGIPSGGLGSLLGLGDLPIFGKEARRTQAS